MKKEQKRNDAVMWIAINHGLYWMKRAQYGLIFMGCFTCCHMNKTIEKWGWLGWTSVRLHYDDKVQAVSVLHEIKGVVISLPLDCFVMSVKTFCNQCHFIAWFVVNHTAIWLKLFCPFLWLKERVMGWWMTMPWKWFAYTPCVCLQCPSGYVFYSLWLARHEPVSGRLLHGDAMPYGVSSLWRGIAMSSGWMANSEQKPQHLRRFSCAIATQIKSKCSLFFVILPLGLMLFSLQEKDRGALFSIDRGSQQSLDIPYPARS